MIWYYVSSFSRYFDQMQDKKEFKRARVSSCLHFKKKDVVGGIEA